MGARGNRAAPGAGRVSGISGQPSRQHRTRGAWCADFMLILVRLASINVESSWPGQLREPGRQDLAEKVPGRPVGDGRPGQQRERPLCALRALPVQPAHRQFRVVGQHAGHEIFGDQIGSQRGDPLGGLGTIPVSSLGYRQASYFRTNRG